MMQGDAYPIPIQIKTSNGVADADTFLDVEIVIGNLRKTLRSGQLTYGVEEQAFMFPITQEESFKLRSIAQPAQVRVKTTTGWVVGTVLDSVDIIKSLSREVL